MAKIRRGFFKRNPQLLPPQQSRIAHRFEIAEKRTPETCGAQSFLTMDEQTSEPDSLSQDELNRLWQHGLHEERLFHDRLNYFSVVEIGLLSTFAILYNKDRPIGLLVALTGAALAFTVFWLLLQYKHWRYCQFINLKQRKMIPEFRETVDTFFDQSASDKQITAFSFSKPLLLAPPVLFALTWMAFLIWVIVNPFAAAR